MTAIAIIGHAQTEPTPTDTLQVTDQDREYAILTRLTDDLDLTDNQVEAVSSLLTGRTSSFGSVAGTNAQKRVAMQAINDEFRNRLASILTTEQWDSYQSLRKELIEFRQVNNVKVDTINDLKDDF